MPEKFVIVQKKSDSHGLWSSNKLDKTHPYLYLGRNSAGHDVQIMSRIGTYKPGSTVFLPGLILAGSIANTYFVDHTDPSPAVAAPVAASATPTPGEAIKDEIMVEISGLAAKSKSLTDVAGTIFYLPPGATGKASQPLRDAMREGERIQIVSNVAYETLDNYMTHFRRAFGFAGMVFVRPPGGIPGTKTVTAIHLVPGTSQESQRSILDAINQAGPGTGQP